MACGACKDRNRTQWEVVTEGGKVVFKSASESTAHAVSKRYTGSTVREKTKGKASA